jgi:hypothetical protein
MEKLYSISSRKENNLLETLKVVPKKLLFLIGQKKNIPLSMIIQETLSLEYRKFEVIRKKMRNSDNRPMHMMGMRNHPLKLEMGKVEMRPNRNILKNRKWPSRLERH